MAEAHESSRNKGSTTQKRHPLYPPQKAATTMVFLAVTVIAVVAVELLASSSVEAAAVLVKGDNGTYHGGCRECRIAEDLELEMLLVDDLYYATVHVSRMILANDKPQGTGNTPDPNNPACPTTNGQTYNCNAPNNGANPQNCPDHYNRNCNSG